MKKNSRIQLRNLFIFAILTLFNTPSVIYGQSDVVAHKLILRRTGNTHHEFFYNLNRYNSSLGNGIGIWTNNTLMGAFKDGRLGLGLTDPLETLHIKDGAIIQEQGGVRVGINNNNAGTAGWIGTLTNHDFILGTYSASKMMIRANGNVGIGTSTPGQKLTVIGAIRSAFSSSEANYTEIGHGNYNSYINAVGEGQLQFRHDGNTLMSLRDDGNLGIGTTQPNKGRLHVKGSVHVENSSGDQVFHISAGKQLVFIGADAYDQFISTQDTDTSAIQKNDYSLWVSKGVVSEDFAVANTDEWADYVFKDGYELMDLEELEHFVKQNNHLPEIPSEAEVKKKGMYDLHKMNMLLLKKIEELTLYTIDQKKEINELKQLKARVQELENKQF